MSIYSQACDAMDDGTPKYMLDDLQLAAELGKTLLERNKELEGNIKQQQIIIDDQSQEIEYLTKQNNALREVNDTRLKIYENIEISIQDLEKQNHRLTIDSSNLKKQNKILTSTNETLEEKCEELRKQIEELSRQIEIERRKSERLLQEQRARNETTKTTAVCLQAIPAPTPIPRPQENGNDKDQHQIQKSANTSISTNANMDNSCIETSLDLVDGSEHFDNEYMLHVVTELDGTKRQLNCEQHRVSELEEQLSALIQENQTLQNRIVKTATEGEEMRSMHEELTFLEDAGQGRMCRRCLRTVDDDALMVPDYASSIACTEDGDDASLADMIASAQNIYCASGGGLGQELALADVSREISAPSPNPYRDLVDKYEALLEVHNRKYNIHRHDETTPVSYTQDELTSGEYNEKENERVTKEITVADGAKGKICLRTPTDFSETETSSSGFADETSNKCTQTDETFLCTIGDGEDKFSIYDEASPIDSRFRHCPKYRALFKEIFTTLKKAAENKDEGEKLPLLDDSHGCPVVPPVTPAVEELPSFPDDTVSVISSAVSEQSVAMSECVTKHERKTVLQMAKKNVAVSQENKPPTGKSALDELRPVRREPDYLAFNANLRKKNKRRGRHGNFDPSDSPVLPSTPRITYVSSTSRRRRDRSGSRNTPTPGSQPNASTVIRSAQSPVPSNAASKHRDRHHGRLPGDSQGSESPVFRRTSTAAHEIQKLIKLDLSYAEVLRRADESKLHRRK